MSKTREKKKPHTDFKDTVKDKPHHGLETTKLLHAIYHASNLLHAHLWREQKAVLLVWFCL